MLQIINWTKKQAPHADIIVVAHSLGSVLVTHCLLGVSRPLSSRLLLVTLGSPLPTMSRVFSRYVFEPCELLARYVDTGSVSFWLHLWRDSDWIGRGIHVTPSACFAEASVGNGLYPNYWADSRVWARLIALMEAQESGKVAELVHDWSATELTNSEMQEVRQLYQAFRFMPLIVLISLACLGYIGRDIFGSAFTATVGRRFLFAVRALYIGNFAFLFPLGFTDLVTRVGGTPKEVLGRLRFASSLFSLCFRLWILAAIAFLALRWLAPRL